MRLTPTRLRKLTHRFTAMLALVVFAGAQLGALLHMVLVEHARCAAHGELVHASTSQVAATHRHDESDAQAVEAGEHGDADAHDHCGFSALAPEPWLASSTESVLVRAEISAPPSSRLSASDAFAPIATLALAPKASPPART